jgi:hypothetical protein
MLTKKSVLAQIISETLYRKLTAEDPTTGGEEHNKDDISVIESGGHRMQESIKCT